MMLKIRDEQVKSFEKAALRAFEDEMVRHFRDFASKRSEVVGEAGMRRGIQLGIEQARGYGLTNRGPVRFYLECLLMFGAAFDIDPLLPWAHAILTDSAMPDQMERADRLFERAMAYLDRVFGPNDAYQIEALRRISGAQIEDYPDRASDPEDFALRALKEVYPQKCEESGDEALRGLIRRGIELAWHHGGPTELGVALFIALPFALGHGFAADPFFPWIAETLEDPRITDPAKRIVRLHTRAKTYLTAALDYFDRRASHV
jgi:hypothetical protein